MSIVYDVIIIGTGVAGLTAGLYTCRARLSTLLLEDKTIGGELMNRDLVENYPGFPKGIVGPNLSSLILNQLLTYEPDIEQIEAKRIRLEGDQKIVVTDEGEYSGKALIIAGGASHKKLGIPGENEFLKKGVFYCATCEGPAYADKIVAVAGGGDSGVTEGLFLTQHASKVTIIEVMPQLNATKILQERIFSNPKIDAKCETKIKRITGDTKVRKIDLFDVKTKRESSMDVDGVLIRVGLDPNTEYLKNIVTLDSKKQILVNDQMETEVPGIFAAGDIRHNSPMQFATAVGDGATAAISAQKYLQTHHFSAR